MTTQTVPFRRPTFSLKKVINPVIKFFVNFGNAIIEARRMKVAMETAQYLKTHNRDFRNWSVGELTMHLLDEENPVGLDKKPIKERE